MMMSFEFKPQKPGEIPDELEINLDAEGLKSLLQELAFLHDGRTDHVHLMCDSWGGAHLDEQPLAQEQLSFKHVKIILR